MNTGTRLGAMWRRYRVPLGIVALAVVTRGRAFLMSRGDANVDTSFYVGATWLYGALPYVAAWDYKPPGIFALSALGLGLFRSAPLAAAILGTFAVVVTALGSAAVLRGLSPDRNWPRSSLAAVAVVLFSVEDQGVLSDAETYVNAFVALAFAAVVSPRSWIVRAVLAGLAAGCALQMKLIAAPLVAAAAWELACRASAARGRSLMIFLALVCAPFGCEALAYARAGSLPAFWDANVGATVRRALGLHREGVRVRNASAWLAQFRVLAPALELAPLVVLARDAKRYASLWVWLFAAAFAVAAAGEYYDRQFLLLVPPVAVLGVVALDVVATITRRRRLTFALGFLLTFALHDYYEIAQGARIVTMRTVERQPDWRAGHYAALLGALRTEPGYGGTLYVLQDSPMLYADLRKPAPTRYVFSGDLLETAMWPMLGFRGRDELARVLATHPGTIAAGRLEGDLDARAVSFVHKTLDTRYRVVGKVDDTTIYRLR